LPWQWKPPQWHKFHYLEQIGFLEKNTT